MTVALSSTALLQNSQVVPEIKLSKDQTDKFNQILDSYQTKFDALTKASAEREKFEELDVDTANKVSALLEPTQKDRLLQIFLQQAGTSALPDEDIAKKLSLTADQVKTIKGLLDEIEKKEEYFDAEIAAALPSDEKIGAAELEKQRQAAIKKLKPKFDALAAEKKSYDVKIYGVFTPEQTSKWIEMQGAKFDPNPKPDAKKGGG